MILRPPITKSTDTLLPYTALFRSQMVVDHGRADHATVLDIAQPRRRLLGAQRRSEEAQVVAHRAQPGGRESTGQSQWRSEEHKSELQSLMRISYDVFCLKKNKMKNIHKTINHKHTTRFTLKH